MKISVASGVVLRTRVQKPQNFLEIRVPQDGALLDIKIVEAGTSVPYAVPNLRLTVFDIDGCPAGQDCTATTPTYGRPIEGQEQLLVCSPHTAVQSTTTKVTPGQSNSCKTYTSQLGGDLDNQPYASTNPPGKSPYLGVNPDGSLSQVAKDLSVELVYTNRAEFQMGYKVVGGSNEFRTMLLNGYGELTECVPVTPAPPR